MFGALGRWTGAAWQAHREGRRAVGRMRFERAAMREDDLMGNVEAEAKVPG
jgi:hypothetical protein